MPKLTKRVVDALRPSAAGEAFAWDSDLKGFGVRVMPTGVASLYMAPSVKSCFCPFACSSAAR
jgi:hypothetical protein